MNQEKIEWDEIKQKKFEQLYDTYSKLMYYIAFDVLKDEGLAQDAVQEAFINISKSFSKIIEKDCQDLKGFVVIVIRRVAINIYNKRKKYNVVSLENILEKGIGTKENGFLENNLTAAIEENKVVYYIRKLPDKYADIMLLYYVYGYTVAEISGMFDINMATVYSYMSRGRKRLERLLEGKKLLNGHDNE